MSLPIVRFAEVTVPEELTFMFGLTAPADVWPLAITVDGFDVRPSIEPLVTLTFDAPVTLKKLSAGFNVRPAVVGLAEVGLGEAVVGVGAADVGLAELIVGDALALELLDESLPHADSANAPTAAMPTARTTDFLGVITAIFLSSGDDNVNACLGP